MSYHLEAAKALKTTHGGWQGTRPKHMGLENKSLLYGDLVLGGCVDGQMQARALAAHQA